MNLAYQRLFNATRAIRDERCADWEIAEPTTSGCACCGRPWGEVEQPGRAVVQLYGNVKTAGLATEWYCTTCKTLKQAAPDALGIQRRAGNSDKMVYARLGMLRGAGAVVTTDDVLYLAVTPGQLVKFKYGHYSLNGQVFAASPLSLLLHLDNKGVLGPMDEGVLLIENFGRKADCLMPDLRVTTGDHEVWANAENGPRPVEMARLKRLCAVLAEQGVLDKASKEGFWRPIRDAAKGRLDRDALTRWSSKLSDPQAVTDALPINPAQRISLHNDINNIRQANHL